MALAVGISNSSPDPLDEFMSEETARPALPPLQAAVGRLPATPRRAAEEEKPALAYRVTFRRDRLRDLTAYVTTAANIPERARQVRALGAPFLFGMLAGITAGVLFVASTGIPILRNSPPVPTIGTEPAPAVATSGQTPKVQRVPADQAAQPVTDAVSSEFVKPSVPSGFRGSLAVTSEPTGAHVFVNGDGR